MKTMSNAKVELLGTPPVLLGIISTLKEVNWFGSMVERVYVLQNSC
jgi:hypothetical protein